jgi:hypothetical protein
VDQVVGDLDPVEGALEAGGVRDVRPADLTPLSIEMLGPRWVADERTHADSGVEQGLGELGADEACGAGYEGESGDAPRLPSPGLRDA